jgi:galacturan 1,4-alpha-galacturonidase
MRFSTTAALVMFALDTKTTSLDPKVAPCIPEAANLEKVDDAPAIQAALRDCGANGQIQIPIGSLYNIMTPIDFSACRSCLFQLDGTLNISNKDEDWREKPAVFYFPGAQVARIVSNTGAGIINGNGMGGNKNLVPMFNITQGSSTLVFENFRIVNPLGTFFELDGHNSFVEFLGLNLTWSAPPSAVPSRLDGFSVANTSDVKIWRTNIDHVSSCINIQNGAVDSIFRDVSCISSRAGVWMDVEWQRTHNMQQMVRNIDMRDLKISQTTTATGVRAGNTGKFTATNVTWDGVRLDTVGSWAEITSCIGGPRECGDNPALAFGTELHLDVVFKNFDGTAWYNDVQPVCRDTAVTKNQCKIKVENVVIEKSPVHP